MRELGERLRRLRESVKLSQVKMAELLGVKQSSINRYEQGQSLFGNACKVCGLF